MHRLSVFDRIKMRKNDIKHVGFDYRGRILLKTLSGHMFDEVKRRNILAHIEKVLVFLVESVKEIKKTYSWVHSKKYRDFN